MKKKVGFISLVLLLIGFISCSPLREKDQSAEQINHTSFSIGGMSIDYTEVEVTDGTNGNVVVLNAEQATGLYDSLKNIVFEKVTPSSLSPGWCYSVKFMKNGIIVEDIVVKDANTITYKDAVYQTKSGTIDLDYFSSLLNYSFRAEVISIEDALMVAPSEDSNEAKSSDRIAINLHDTQLLNKEGVPITKEEIKTGDYLVVTYNGVIAESYPAQIAASRIEVVDHNKLIDAYTALIDDIYNEDSGLNGDITTIAFDTTDWKLLTDIDKEIILEGVRNSYGYDVVTGTYEELAEQGLIDKDKLFFKKGILITISNLTYDEKLENINCAMKKWRSGDGAIGSEEVTAQLEGKEWKVTKKGMWIS